MSTSLLNKRIFQKLGTPEEMRQSVMKFQTDVNLLSVKRASLTKKHPDKWVAFYDGKIVAIGSTLDKILMTVDDKGLPREAIVTQFLGTRKIKMIL